MTATGRAVVACVALIAGVLLVMLGTIVHDSGSTTSGVALAGPVLGYVFGDKNGEKRLAAALMVLQADQVTSATGSVAERHATVAARAIHADDATKPARKRKPKT